jgi:hypothetical protein
MRTIRLAAALALVAVATPRDARAWIAVHAGFGCWHPVYAAPLAGAMVAGAMVGAAAARAAPVYTYPPPVYSYPAPVYDYPPPAPDPLTIKLPVNSTMWTLPHGCNAMTVAGQSYHQCGVNWMKPYFGANGTYYGVVPAP